MITPKTITDAQYFKEGLVDDEKFNYYTEQQNKLEAQEKFGVWAGKLANDFNLHGNIRASDFKNITNGMAPNGETKLIQSAMTDDEKKEKSDLLKIELAKFRVENTKLNILAKKHGLTKDQMKTIYDSDFVNPKSEKYLRDITEQLSEVKDAKRSVDNAKKNATHRCGIDFVWTPVKDHSTAFYLPNLPDEFKEQILKAEAEAQASIIKGIEDNSLVRVGAGGNELKKADAIAIAIFGHETARPTEAKDAAGNMVMQAPDMNKHKHLFVPNAARLGDKTYAIDTRIIGSGEFRLKEDAKANAILARAYMKMNFKLNVRELKGGVRTFSIAGLEKANDVFSKRSKNLAELKAEHDEAVKNGTATEPWNARLENLKNRLDKASDLTLSDLQEDWNKQYKSVEVDFKSVKNAQPLHPIRKLTDEELVERCCQMDVKFSSYILERVVYEEAMFDPDFDPEKRIQQIKENPNLIFVAKQSNETPAAKDRLNNLGEFAPVEYISINQLKQQIILEDRINKFRNDLTHEVSKQYLDGLIAIQEAKQGWAFNQEQKNAMKVMTGPNGIAHNESSAGTGKTASAIVICDAYAGKGYKTLLCAAGGNAADVFTQDTKREADTIDALVLKTKPEKYNAGDKVLVMVDEAGMCSQKNLIDLTRLTDALKARGVHVKLLMQGDTRQLSPVGAGNPLKRFVDDPANKALIAKMTEINRQKQTWQKEASKAAARGDFKSCINAYEENGAIKTTSSLNEAYKHIAQAYKESELPSTQKLALAFKNEDAEALNAAIRLNEIEAGNIKTSTEISIKTEIKENGGTKEGTLSIAVGDRILLRENKKIKDVKGDFRIYNGNRATILEIIKNKDSGYDLRLQVDGTDKREVMMHVGDISGYSAISLGYASSIHKSQGATKQDVFVLHTTEGAALSYVALTRHKANLKIFTQEADRDKMIESMSKYAPKKNCSDFIDNNLFQKLKTDVSTNLEPVVQTKTRFDENKIEAVKGLIQKIKDNKNLPLLYPNQQSLGNYNNEPMTIERNAKNEEEAKAQAQEAIRKAQETAKAATVEPVKALETKTPITPQETPLKPIHTTDEPEEQKPLKQEGILAKAGRVKVHSVGVIPKQQNETINKQNITPPVDEKSLFNFKDGLFKVGNFAEKIFDNASQAASSIVNYKKNQINEEAERRTAEIIKAARDEKEQAEIQMQQDQTNFTKQLQEKMDSCHFDEVKTFVFMNKNSSLTLCGVYQKTTNNNYLHLAAMQGESRLSLEIIKLKDLDVEPMLLEKNAKGQTPEEVAQEKEKQNALEAKNRIQVNKKCIDKINNADYTQCKASEVVEKLTVNMINNKLSFDGVKMDTRMTNRTIELMAKNGVNPNITYTYNNGQQETFLTDLTKQDRCDCVRQLLRYSRQIDTPNSEGRTPLHLAAIKGNRDLVDSLLSYGSNPNNKDNQGNTALHYCKNVECYRKLTYRNADTNIKNKDNETPLDMYRKKGNLDLVRAASPALEDENAKNIKKKQASQGRSM